LSASRGFSPGNRRSANGGCGSWRSGAAYDPAVFAAHGIDLAATRLLCVKATNHFRAAFAKRCAAIFDVDCPGPMIVDAERVPRVDDPGASLPGGGSRCDDETSCAVWPLPLLSSDRSIEMPTTAGSPQ
jgi:hypothetical protein